MNETTRKFARTLEEAFPENTEAIQKRNDWIWYEGNRMFSPDAEFWTYITLAFAAGFLVALFTIGT